MPQEQEPTYEEYINSVESQLKDLNAQNRQLHNAYMEKDEHENMVKWQLEMDKEKNEIYHRLKGDIMKEDDKGNIFFVAPADENLIPFNEFGAQLIMQRLNVYLNRCIILSDFEEDMIEDLTFDFGSEFISLIYCRYEEMMMTTTIEKEYAKLFKKRYNPNLATKIEMQLVDEKIVEHLEGKQKMFMMVVTEITTLIYAAFRRALKGGERRELRTARSVTQNDSGNRMPNYPVVQSNQKQRSLLKPWTYI